MLTIAQRAFLSSARRAILATNTPDGRSRIVPICFVVDDDQPVVYSPIDDKPKRSEDPTALARVRDLIVDPHATILVDRWDEDWALLAWLRCEGTASLIESGGEHTLAVRALRSKYRQYATHHLEIRPIIRIGIERSTDWGELGPS